MISVSWTRRAQEDLVAIHDYLSQHSPHYAAVVVDRLIAIVEQIWVFPDSGRAVPEFGDASVREIVRKPYRIVYRRVNEREIHVLTIHHAARMFPDEF